MKRRRCGLSYLFALILACSVVAPAGAQDVQLLECACFPIVFVSGIGGFGEDDAINRIFPVWGMMGGSVAKYLNSQGYEAATASVGPFSGSWDRACELYAHITGTRTDYGAAHAAASGHSRYGPSYEKALVPGWNDTDRRVHLIGYSFGGTTVRMLAQLLRDGSPEERAATPSGALSLLFSGTLGGRVASITTLGAPHNGSTAFEPAVKKNVGALRTMMAGGAYLLNALPLDWFYSLRLGQYGMSFLEFWLRPWEIANTCRFFTSTGVERADLEMTIDGAAKLNEQLECLPDIYYFSYTALMTEEDGQGNQVPQKGMWTAFRGLAGDMGARRAFTTPGGIFVDETWLPNDGQVNLVSARHPFDEPARAYDPEHMQSGVWQLMPTLEQDHFDFAGGVKHMFGGTPGTKEFYLGMAQMLEATQN